MARVLDLGKPCLEGGLEDGSWVVGAQLKPGTQTRLLIIGRIIGELDAEMSSAGKTDVSIQGWGMGCGFRLLDPEATDLRRGRG